MEDKKYIVLEVGDRPVVFKSTEPQESPLCFGCAFYEGEYGNLCSRACAIQSCCAQNRQDMEQVIWVLA